MTRETAQKVIDLMLLHGRQLDSLVELIQTTESPEEFNKYRRSVAAIMAEMLLEVMNPIFREHPDLKPAGL